MASSSIVLTCACVSAWEYSYRLFVPPCEHKSAWCFLPHQSKKEADCERGHGNVVAFFLAVRLERRVFTQATFPLSDANTAFGPRFRVGALIRGGGQGVVYRGSRQAHPTGDRSATTAPSSTILIPHKTSASSGKSERLRAFDIQI